MVPASLDLLKAPQVPLDRLASTPSHPCHSHVYADLAYGGPEVEGGAISWSFALQPFSFESRNPLSSSESSGKDLSQDSYILMWLTSLTLSFPGAHEFPWWILYP